LLTEMLHGDVIAGTSIYDHLDHEFGEASDILLSGYPTRGRHWLADDDGSTWDVDDNQQFADQRRRRQRSRTARPDADVRRDVLRTLVLDSLVPLTVDAQVSDGVVTLTGTVGTPGWGTVALSGAVQSRSNHDLAIATALSVAGIEAVDDCIQVEC
jgi:hypothetical protein